MKAVPALSWIADDRHKFWLAAAASLLLHSFLAWGLYDYTIGWDIAWSTEPAQIYRVRVEPAKRDLLDSWSAFDVPSDEGIEATTVDQLSATLLAETSPPPRGLGSSPLAASRTPPDSRDEPAPPIQQPPSQQPDILEEFIGDLSLDTPTESDEPAAGVPDGSDDYRGPLTEAQKLLARAGLNIAPPPTAAALAPPIVYETPPSSDRRPTMPLIRTPPFDLNAIELQAAANLDRAQTLDDDFEYTLTIYRPVPKRNEPAEEGYFRVDVAARRSLRKLATMPKDVVYVLDISGSVSQEWVNAAMAGVRDALNSLNEGDRFNIVMFSEQPAFFSTDAIQPVETRTLDAARDFLKNAQSSGDTDVNRALARLLVRDVAVERVYELVLISDGRPTKGVTSTRDLINIVTRDNDLAASIYCVGIGDRQNRQLLEFLAYRNRGFCVYAQTPVTASRTIRDLASRLRYPIIKNMQLFVSGFDQTTVFPVTVPNIHQGETFSIFGRFADLNQFTMQLAGRSHAGNVAFTFTRDLGRANLGDEQLAHDWAFWKLHHLYSELLRQGDTKERREEIEKLAKRYKLKTMY